MAYTATQQTTSVWASIKDFFSMVGEAMTMSAAAEVRMRRIDALNAKTDAELAEMGLRRQDIASYVFRDLMYC
ncbi:hypothetical protein [Tateyamaria sp. SN6-1]|uniref:hypothetical protein n=1 Tax=Tateyamaria sp. SN6-1 TaxID=3092148 RepID=UPI0039F5FE28